MSDVTFSRSLLAGLGVGAGFAIMISLFTILIFVYLYIEFYRPYKRLNKAIRFYGQTKGYDKINGIFFLELAEGACNHDIPDTIQYLEKYDPPFKITYAKHDVE